VQQALGELAGAAKEGLLALSVGVGEFIADVHAPPVEAAPRSAGAASPSG
jgi:hypothetical protein